MISLMGYLHARAVAFAIGKVVFLSFLAALSIRTFKLHGRLPQRSISLNPLVLLAGLSVLGFAHQR